MTTTDTVFLRPLYGWICPGCGRHNVEAVVAVDEALVPAETAAAVRARWRIAAAEPIPDDKLYTWPKSVTCREPACRRDYLSEVGELTLLDP